MTESKRIEKLLSGEEIGDRKPSEFYRYLKNLAGDSTSISEGLLKELWLRRLSSIVSAMVKSSGKTNIKDLIEIADSVHETLQTQTFNVNAMASFSSNDTSMAMIELKLQNQKLQAEISEMKAQLSRSNSTNSFNDRGYNDRNRSPNRFNNRFRSLSRFRNRSPIQNSNNFCYYHSTYGNRARQCRPPCNFHQTRLSCYCSGK